jgi:hypothetical protein
VDAPAKPTGCPNCGSAELYVCVKPVPSGGGYAPDLLPGLHPWFRGAKLRNVLCASCGLLRQFADEAAREIVRTSGKWRRL